jgi:hypothetical protein
MLIEVSIFTTSDVPSTCSRERGRERGREKGRYRGRERGGERKAGEKGVRGRRCERKGKEG